MSAMRFKYRIGPTSNGGHDYGWYNDADQALAADCEVVIWDPREVRAEVVARIDAHEHGDIIAEEVRAKIHRYVDMEVLSTEKDDHTRSLSERVAVLEQALGEARSSYEASVRFWEHQRHMDYLEKPWWLKIGRKPQR